MDTFSYSYRGFNSPGGSREEEGGGGGKNCSGDFLAHTELVEAPGTVGRAAAGRDAVGRDAAGRDARPLTCAPLCQGVTG